MWNSKPIVFNQIPNIVDRYVNMFGSFSRWFVPSCPFNCRLVIRVHRDRPTNADIELLQNSFEQYRILCCLIGTLPHTWIVRQHSASWSAIGLAMTLEKGPFQRPISVSSYRLHSPSPQTRSS
jgi:hypothetical protein